MSYNYKNATKKILLFTLSFVFCLLIVIIFSYSYLLKQCKIDKEMGQVGNTYHKVSRFFYLYHNYSKGWDSCSIGIFQLRRSGSKFIELYTKSYK